MGGGSGGGGGMLRSVQRAVRAGVSGAPADPFSHFGEAGRAKGRNSAHKSYKKETTASNTTLLTLSSSSSDRSRTYNNGNNGSAAFSTLISAAPAWRGCSSPTRSDDSEWEYVDGSDDETTRLFYDDLVFGNVPSRDEVQQAVSALQLVLGPSSVCLPEQILTEDAIKDVKNGVPCSMVIDKVGYSSDSEIDWAEPSTNLCNTRMALAHHGSDRVYDAFHLLQTEPSIQKMVVSLSSDKSVWEAVLNNEVVKELRSSIARVVDERGKNPDERSSHDSSPMKDILSLVFVNAQAKIIHLIDKITKLVRGIFMLPDEEEKGHITDPLEETLKTPLFLSIIVLFVVIVTRVQSA